MGCDIHSRAERKVDGKWEIINPGYEPFGWRDYRVFAFLAGVRNTFDIPPLSPPRGLPDDIADDGDDNYLGDHSFSWLAVQELLDFDYDQPAEIGPESCHSKPDWFTTWRELFGKRFFVDLKTLELIGAERIVFGFDN
jgi:hypothetical protein